MLRLFRKISIWFLIIFLFLLGSGVVLSILFRDEVNSLLVEEINKRIITEINVGELRFSLLRKFPSASVEFRDVLIRSPISYKPDNTEFDYGDTLLFAEHLFLEFSIFDFVRKEYRIKRIHADRGTINIYVDNEGISNYRFWKTFDAADTSVVEINLNDMKFSRLNFHVVNMISHFDFMGFSEMFALEGNFSSGSFELHSAARMFVEELALDGIDYISARQTEIDLKIAVNDSLYTIDNGDLIVSGLKFGVTGSFSTGSMRGIDLNVIGKNLDLPSIISVLPERLHKRFEQLRTAGNLNFEATLTGNYGIKGPPHLESRFGLEQATVSPRGSDIRLDNLDISGTYTNGALNKNGTALLEVNRYSFSIENTELSGSGRIWNFEKPRVDLLITGSFDLGNIHRFLQPDTIEYMGGMVLTNLRLEGQIEKLSEITWSDMKDLNPAGQAILKDASFRFKGGTNAFSEVNGTVMFGNHLWIDGVSLNVNGNSFYIVGKLGNALPYLFSQSKHLLIEADIRSDEIVFDRFISESENLTDTGISDRIINFPDNIQMNLNLDIGGFSYQNFSATQFSGLLSYKSKMAFLQSASFNSMGGTVSGWGVLVESPNGGYSSRIQSRLEQINITNLFRSFKNFGQEYIRDVHLNGVLSGEVDFTAELDSAMKVRKETVLAENHLIITNGELIDFEPLLGLSKFIEVSELKHITFSTLENEILIKDEKVTVPQMDIHSSAFNITLSGVHDFDNNISYKTRVLLSEVLFRKAKQAKRENEEFGVVEDDGLGRTSLYLTISGKPGDIKVSYDRKEMRQAVAESLQNERKELRQILNEEFGWFEKDTTKEAEGVDKPPRQFLIEWEDMDTTLTDSADMKQENLRFRIEWMDNEEATDTLYFLKSP
ncbi:MAG: hypothetical protein JSV24_04990 [Bacteroidales bacterium]|nr:MAG: hypothetical protein JSV24_04990 [Bacteroidales bacterium]